MVKIVPNRATRLSWRLRSSAPMRLDDVISGNWVRDVSSLTQMCGVTAGRTAAVAPARPSRSMKPAEIVGQRVEPAFAHEALSLLDVGVDDGEIGITRALCRPP